MARNRVLVIHVALKYAIALLRTFCREYSVVKYSSRTWPLAYGHTRDTGGEFEKAQASQEAVVPGRIGRIVRKLT